MLNSSSITSKMKSESSAVENTFQKLAIISYGFFVVIQVLGLSSWGLFLPGFKSTNSKLALVVLLLTILFGAFSKWSIKRMLLFLMFSCGLIAYVLLYRSSIIAFCFLAILAGQGIPFTKLLKIDFFSRISSIIFVVTLSFFDILPRSGAGSQITGFLFTQFSYGFTYPNILGYLLLIVFIESYVLYAHTSWQKFTLVVCTAIIEINLNYLTGLGGVIVSLLAVGLFQREGTNEITQKITFRLFTIGTCILFWGGVLGSLFVAQNYNSSSDLWNAANKLFSLRFPIWQYYFLNWPPNFWGNVISVNQTTLGLVGFGAFDGAYLFFLLKFGIVGIGLIFLSFLFGLLGHKSSFVRRVLVMLLATILVTGIPETNGFLISFGPLFLLLGSSSVFTVQNEETGLNV